MRIVSMLPSATEIICAVGAGAALVGVSHECDYPPEVRGLPVVTRAKIDAHGTSAAIHEDVQALVRRGLGIYEIDVERLRALRPDVIVTQHQCDVCAVPFAEVEAAARAAIGSAVTIVSLAPRVLADVWQDVERVAAAVERTAAGRAVVARIADRLGALMTATRGLDRPSVACLEWLDPLMMAGNWMPELVDLASGDYGFARIGEASAVATWDALVAAQPEVVVLLPCGFTIEQTRRELPEVRARPEWSALRAVRRGRASIVDGNAYCNRPGPRLVESAEILAALLHPAECGRFTVPGAAEAIPF